MKYKLTTITFASILACGTVHAQSNKEMAAQIIQETAVSRMPQPQLMAEAPVNLSVGDQSSS